MSVAVCPQCDERLPQSLQATAMSQVVRCESCGALLLWASGRVLRAIKTGDRARGEAPVAATKPVAAASVSAPRSADAPPAPSTTALKSIPKAPSASPLPREPLGTGADTSARGSGLVRPLPLAGLSVGARTPALARPALVKPPPAVAPPVERHVTPPPALDRGWDVDDEPIEASPETSGESSPESGWVVEPDEADSPSSAASESNHAGVGGSSGPAKAVARAPSQASPSDAPAVAHAPSNGSRADLAAPETMPDEWLTPDSTPDAAVYAPSATALAAAPAAASSSDGPIDDSLAEGSVEDVALATATRPSAGEPPATSSAEEPVDWPDGAANHGSASSTSERGDTTGVLDVSIGGRGRSRRALFVGGGIAIAIAAAAVAFAILGTDGSHARAGFVPVVTREHSPSDAATPEKRSEKGDPDVARTELGGSPPGAAPMVKASVGGVANGSPAKAATKAADKGGAAPSGARDAKAERAAALEAAKRAAVERAHAQAEAARAEQAKRAAEAARIAAARQEAARQAAEARREQATAARERAVAARAERLRAARATAQRARSEQAAAAAAARTRAAAARVAKAEARAAAREAKAAASREAKAAEMREAKAAAAIRAPRSPHPGRIVVDYDGPPPAPAAHAGGKRGRHRRNRHGALARAAGVSPAPAAASEPITNAEAQAVEKARADYRAAGVKLFAGDFATAEGSYRQSLVDFPGYVAAYRGLGLVLLRKGDTAGALEAWSTYLRLAPEAKDAWLVKKRIARVERHTPSAAAPPVAR